MTYVAAKGGKEAIKEAEKLVNYYRCKGGSPILEIKQILDQMRLAVDKVMGEGSLYAPELAALALKQSEGDTLEASFLLRAFRTTLPRIHYSFPSDTTNMRIIRRISSAFKDIPGGQHLGPTRDYAKRLLDFNILKEEDKDVKKLIENFLDSISEKDVNIQPTFSNIINLLQQEGLIDIPDNNEKKRSKDICDATRMPLRIPATRAMRLQIMAMGETGSMMALAYSSMRGYGAIHPTIGELKVGYIDIVIPHPFRDEDYITIGEVLVTEVTLIARMEDKGKESKPQLSLGYGVCFGHNEVKAISMSTLDRTMKSDNQTAPAENEEFVLYHIDGIESSGFTAHWKLPHYVDFQANLNRVRSIQKRKKAKEGNCNERV